MGTQTQRLAAQFDMLWQRNRGRETDAQTGLAAFLYHGVMDMTCAIVK